MKDQERKEKEAGLPTSREVRGILNDPECKVDEPQPQTMTAAGFLERTDKGLEAFLAGQFPMDGIGRRQLNFDEGCLFGAISALREACLVMAADIAGLKNMMKHRK